MSFDRLKAFVAAAALLSALVANTSGAESPVSSEAGAVGGPSDVQADVDQNPLPAAADDPTYSQRHALAMKLFELSAPPDFSEQLTDSLVVSTLSTISINHGALSEAEQATAEDIMRQQFVETQDKIIGRIASFYADLFLVEELEELVAFHGTETGAKFRALAKELNNSVSASLSDATKEMESIVLSEIRPQQEGVEAAEALPVSPNQTTELHAD